MNITVQARHMAVTDAIRQFVESKAPKLERMYDGLQSVEVILDIEAEQALTEIVVTGRRKSTFVASHRDPDMYTSIEQCLHKITEQLRRHKDKVRDRQGPSHGQTAEESGG